MIGNLLDCIAFVMACGALIQSIHAERNARILEREMMETRVAVDALLRRQEELYG